jgi:2-oxoisovalerate dehydrogenase E1 component alpha subunit
MPVCRVHNECREVCSSTSNIRKSADLITRVLFPGALNSEFTNTLKFLKPSDKKAIPTYRVLDQYGEVLDKEIGVETEDGEALELYRNMVCCA